MTSIEDDLKKGLSNIEHKEKTLKESVVNTFLDRNFFVMFAVLCAVLLLLIGALCYMSFAR